VTPLHASNPGLTLPKSDPFSRPAAGSSSALLDLRNLVTEGVRKSDTIVLLATKGVLSRPYASLQTPNYSDACAQRRSHARIGCITGVCA
jgi:hypothetical protein